MMTRLQRSRSKTVGALIPHQMAKSGHMGTNTTRQEPAQTTTKFGQTPNQTTDELTPLSNFNPPTDTRGNLKKDGQAEYEAE